MKLRHSVIALVIFALLVGLMINAYSGLTQNYGVVKSDTRDGQDVMDRFERLNIFGELNQTTTSIYKITAPTSTSLDILGALASAAIGVLKATGKLLTLPFQIGAILLEFYPVPTILISSIILMITLYVGFLLLSAYLRFET